ncbi:hypothetical protein MRX96_013872 [Rhipicephalus microplus]
METCCLFLLATFAVASAASWSSREVDAAMERAREEIRMDAARTPEDRASGGCPYASLRHQHSRRATKEAAQLARVARLFEETSRELLRSFSSENWSDDAVERLEAVDLSSTALSGYCPLTNVTCDPAKRYRNADGTCNNLQNPAWGSANSCMNRLLPPAYQDGVSSPRVAVDGSPLPNARKISYMVHPNVRNSATNITHMVMQLGQFIDHDFALAPLMADPGEIVDLGNPNNVIDCCSPGRRNAPDCFSIEIPFGRPFLRSFQPDLYEPSTLRSLHSLHAGTATATGHSDVLH